MIWDKESSEALCRIPFEEEKLNNLVIKASEEVPLYRAEDIKNKVI